jgi:hypothetical protein
MASEKEVVIGILGERLLKYFLEDYMADGCLAMQGAFAEHQVMLKKVRIENPIRIVLIRQASELDQCDALIIPGGGKF